jgi:hypothetical protein
MAFLARTGLRANFTPRSSSLPSLLPDLQTASLPFITPLKARPRQRVRRRAEDAELFLHVHDDNADRLT